MSAVDSPRRPHAASGSSGSAGSRRPSRSDPLRRFARAPSAWVAVCCGLAVVSWATLPTVPSYDPWSWIVWGREVTDPHLSFVISGGPSWKPLPFLFTTVWGLFGGAAPTLWVITARIGGLLGLVAAWRLANRLAGRGWAGAVAGTLAIGGIVLTQDWMYYFLRGTSEVGLIACGLWAIDRLLDGRRLQAFWLAVAAALIRPEWWPFLGVYAVWLWLRDPGLARPATRLMVLGGLALVPALWFGPPWIGSGQPLLAATHAAEYDGHLGSDPLRAVIGRGVDLQVWPMLAGGILAVLIATLRDRSRLMLALGVAVVAWWVVVVAMTLDGYPGLERFFLPAAALTCVLGGVGIVRVAQLIGERAEPLAARAAGPVTAGALVVLVGVSVGLSRSSITAARAEGPAAEQAVATIAALRRAVAAVGGHDGVYPCGSRRGFAAVNHSVQTALAWSLHTTLQRVGTAMTDQGVDFVGPHNAADGEAAPVDPRLTDSRTLARVGEWRVLRLTDPRNPHGAPCVGR